MGSSDVPSERPIGWVAERLYNGWAQQFRVIAELAHERSSYQDIRIIQTTSHGRVMLLDDVVQVTEVDEFVYQEMIVHVPLIQHGSVKTVLIIGAGDGGVLRRVMMHTGVGQVTMVEIDEAVVRLAKRYLPTLGGDAWSDPRVDIVIGDGIGYMARATAGSVDIIIVDSTDPAGPGEVLFSEEFYRDCARVLAPGGLLVNQCGVPFMQPAELEGTTKLRRKVFGHVSAYVAAVPTYIGGFLALGIASDRPIIALPISEIASRARPFGLVAASQYWSPAVHAASFSLPPFIARLIAGEADGVET